MRTGVVSSITSALLLISSCGIAPKTPYTDPRETASMSREFEDAGVKSLICSQVSDSATVYSTYVLKGDKWKLKYGPYSVPSATKGDSEYLSLSDSVVVIGGNSYLYSTGVTSDANHKSLVYSASLIKTDCTFNDSAEFFGKNLLPASKWPAFKIEGQSGLWIDAYPTPEVSFLDSEFKSDSRLVVLSEDKYLTDNAIQWWLDHNPQAMTKAKTIEMGTLPETSSAVAAFAKAEKEKNKRYQIGVVDERGYSLVIARNISTGVYTLVWAEPVCRNRKTDRFLRNVYFADENTLAMVYYKGSSMFKYRINLGSRQISR